jgi:hypothetical protein
MHATAGLGRAHDSATSVRPRLEGGLSFGVVLESRIFSEYSTSWPQQKVMIVVLGLANSLLLRFAFVAVPD